MVTNDLLAGITQEALQYMSETVSSGSEVDCAKLKKLFDDKLFEANNFEDTKVNVLDFCWGSLERDRNWWWQLQALPFLEWYIKGYALLSNEDRVRYFLQCLDAINCWIVNAKNNRESPLVWHDHAAAFRVRTLARWILFCHIEKLPIANNPCADPLADLLVEHLDWLGDKKHYSKHTNHGFDQAMVALTVSLMFSPQHFDSYRQQNRERLKDEINFAFSEDGVHKENSPGYQKAMLNRLKQLESLAILGEREIPLLGENCIEKAEGFLRAVTLPNGNLPMIGDTGGENKGLKYVQKEKVDVLDYSKSGYVIVRGKDGSGKPFFIVLKNTHESNYHRHDDDMMIYIYYDGHVVLGDGGLFMHQEKNEKRKHLRSFLSHSVPFINACAIRDKQYITEPPVIRKTGCFSFELTSTMFGEKLYRCVSVFPETSLKIRVTDTAEEGGRRNVWSNFFMENIRPCVLDEACFSFFFPSFIFKVDYESGSAYVMRRGWSQQAAISSKYYAKYEPAQSFSLQSRDKFISFVGKD